MRSDPGGEPLRVSSTADGVIFTLHVQPRASRTEICGIQAGELRLRLTSPPVDDAANRQCIEFLAKALGVPRSRVTIIAGATSRHKTVRVEGITVATVTTLAAVPR